jgi:uncharacterized protein YdgA (DUF945 family)
MRKILIPLVCLLLIAACATPYILGYKTEALYRSKIAELSSPATLDMQVLSYERGWLKSTSQVQVELSLGLPVDSNPELKKLTSFLLQDTIYHGPFTMFLGTFATRAAPGFCLAVLDSAFFFDTEPAVYKMIFGEAPIFTQRTVVDFSGKMASTAYGQPMDAKVDALGANLNWKGFLMQSQLVDRELGYSVEGDGLTFETPDVAFKLGGWRESGQMTLHQNGIYTGNQKGALDGANANATDGPLFEVGAITYQVSTRQDDGRLSGETTMELSPATVMGEAYGPATTKVEMGNIAATEVAELFGSLNEMAAAQPFIAEENGPKNFTELLTDGQTRLIVEILAASPRVSLSQLSFVTPEGTSNGSADLGFDGAELTAELNADDLVKRLYAEWKFTLPLELALRVGALSSEIQQQAMQRLLSQNPNTFPSQEEMARLTYEMAQAVLKSFAKQQFISIEGQTISITGALKEGSLTLGNKVIPIGEKF